MRLTSSSSSSSSSSSDTLLEGGIGDRGGGESITPLSIPWIMEAFETMGKGGPTWLRKTLFQRIVVSLKQANGEKVNLSSFIATISIATGLKRKTVAGMIELLDEGGVVELNEDENWIRLVGAGE